MEEFLEWTVVASVTFYWQALWLRVLFWSSREIVGVESGGGATMRVGVGSGRCGGGYGSCGCSQSE